SIVAYSTEEPVDPLESNINRITYSPNNTDNMNPTFRQNNIPVVFATDDNYALPLCVCLQSFVENSNSNNNYDIWILDSEISNKHCKDLYNVIKNHNNFSLRFLDISSFVSSYINELPCTKRWVAACFYRLFLPTIFSEYSKMVYLDCDIIIQNDVANLYNIDLHNHLIGGEIDLSIKERKICMKNKRKGKFIKEYINSGVLLFNLEEMRKGDFLNKCLNIFNTYKTRLADQDVINIVCNFNKILINGNWNSIVSRVKNPEEHNILHYAGIKKPWKNPSSNPLNNIWWKFASKTQVYDDLIAKYRTNVEEEEKCSS
ncbi:MAG: glycosyltransferase family 8 protein, partial [Holosporales bacterium]|nr:glycosyltransferase family 8 protein [Holosporales bacterium]